MIDTSVWIEISNGTEKGLQTRSDLVGSKCFVASESMAEISKWCFENGKDENKIFADIGNVVEAILYMDRKAEKKAGELCWRVNRLKKRGERRIGLVDCIIATLAEENGLTVVTLDHDFSELGIKAKIIK